MPNRSYRLGRDDEQAVRVLVESCGCAVVRAAGSRGTADLVVSDSTTGRTYALDVKRNAWAPPKARARMASVWYPSGALPYLVRVTLGYRRARTLTYRQVGRDGGMGPPSELAPWDA